MIYLDNNATTKTDGRVIETMLPFYNKYFFNPSSSYTPSFNIRKQVEEARINVARLINANPDEIYFTSGATEAINTVFRGVVEKSTINRKHIITVKTEHKAVLEICNEFEKHGVDITYLDVDKFGIIDLKELEFNLNENTLLVCIMFANNETGVIQPISEISQIVSQSNALFFSDTTQAIGKIEVDVKNISVDAACLSAHKIYGPKGCGALYIRSKFKNHIQPLILGGGQEFNFRGGTLNVPGIIGLGKTAQLLMKEREIIKKDIEPLRNLLETELKKLGLKVNCETEKRLFNTTSICFMSHDITTLLNGTSGILVSSGSACKSSANKPSHVLKAIGLNEQEALSSIRFSLGKYNTSKEMETSIQIIKNHLDKN